MAEKNDYQKQAEKVAAGTVHGGFKGGYGGKIYKRGVTTGDEKFARRTGATMVEISGTVRPKKKGDQSPSIQARPMPSRDYVEERDSFNLSPAARRRNVRMPETPEEFKSKGLIKGPGME